MFHGDPSIKALSMTRLENHAIEARFCVYDVDALYDYFKARNPLAPVSANHIARSNRNELQLDRALSEWRATT
jgi:hypothetical protein